MDSGTLRAARWWTILILVGGTCAAAVVVGITPRTWQATARIVPMEGTPPNSVLPLVAGPEVASRVLTHHPSAVLDGAIDGVVEPSRFAIEFAARVRATADDDGIWLVVRDTDPARAAALLDAVLGAAERVAVETARHQAADTSRQLADELDAARAGFETLVASAVPPSSIAEHALWSARLRVAADAVAATESALADARRRSRRTDPPWTVEHRSRDVLRPLPRRITPVAAAAFLVPAVLALLYWAILRR
jgi:hypothetical protein